MVDSFVSELTAEQRLNQVAAILARGANLRVMPPKSAEPTRASALAADPALSAEVLWQAQEQFAEERAELAPEQWGLEQELARHHADLRKLCSNGPATGPAGARLAELHDRVAQAETRLAELRRRIEEHQRDRLHASDIDAAFADFDNAWNALSPREQAQVLALLVTRVEFDAADSTVAVSFHLTAIKTLARKQLGGAA